MFKAKVRRAHVHGLCGWEWTPPKGTDLEPFMGYPVKCGGLINHDGKLEPCDETAYVVKYQDETGWLRVRRFFESVETKWSLLRFLRWPAGREEEFVWVMTVVVLGIAAALARWDTAYLYVVLGAILVERVVELTLVQISVAFVSRWQRDPLRTFVLWLLNYVQVIAAFGCFYWMLPPTQFDHALGSIRDGIYVSAVTITTLGDSKYSPVAYTAKTLVVLEVGLGLILVAAVLTVLLTSVSATPPPKLRRTVSKLIKELNEGDEDR